MSLVRLFCSIVRLFTFSFFWGGGVGRFGQYSTLIFLSGQKGVHDVELIEHEFVSSL